MVVKVHLLFSLQPHKKQILQRVHQLMILQLELQSPSLEPLLLDGTHGRVEDSGYIFSRPLLWMIDDKGGGRNGLKLIFDV
jgi:hypothetical protein